MGIRSALRDPAGAGAPILSACWCPWALLLTLGLLASAATPAADPPHEPLERMPTASVSIDAGGRSYPFTVWIAATEARREQGLMYVRHLAPDRGMLFIFEQPQVVNFWMHDTFIPLDLLFIAPSGRIIRIAENATPMSDTTLSSMGAVDRVLELAGGSSARLGLRPGQTLTVERPANR